MIRAALVLFVGFLALSLVPVAPSASASAIFACGSGPSGGGGIVGQTIDYVDAELQDNCENTLLYVYEVCVDLVGPGPCAIE